MSQEAETSQSALGAGEGLEHCFSCGTRRALAWRTDRDSKQVTCNRCYLQRYKPDTGEPAKKPKGKAKKSKSTEISDSFAEDHKAESDVASGAAVDLSGYPLRIRVECSPCERVNGIYARAADAINSKPYYSSTGSKKLTQLFLHSKEWKFGNVNKSGFYAKVKADKGHSLPTEPYPFAWKVLRAKHAESNETQDAPAMRVIDLDLDASLSAEASLPAQPAEKGASLLLDSHAKMRSKKRRKIGDVSPGGSVAAKKMKEGESTNQDGLVESKDVKSQESSEDESRSESNSESSSSSSESDKSSGTAPSPKAKAIIVTEVELPKEVVYDPKKAGAFEDKLRGALKKASTKEGRAKLRMIAMNPQQYTKVSTMTHDDLMAFCDRMYEEHGKPVPRPPPGEPPRHLLEKAGILPAPALACAEAAQLASTLTQAENLMPHRNPNEQQPTRSCIRRTHLGKFNPDAKRISFYNSGSGDHYDAETPRANIDSMRKYLNHLWFQQPGAMVTCDKCEQEVPQTCGCLQGAQGSSQFAQSIFVCQACM